MWFEALKTAMPAIAFFLLTETGSHPDKNFCSIRVANTNPEKDLTPRQLRRQQQREANLARPGVDPAPVVTLPKPSEFLGPSVLVPAFSAMIVAGYLLFQLPGFAVHTGNELSKHQAVFTAVNAGTLTGFRQALNPDHYTPGGQLLTAALTTGGMLFSFIGCGAALLRIARMPFRDRHLVLWAVGSILVVAVMGGFALMGQDRSFSAGAFQAISAFGNSGLTLGGLPAQNTIQASLVILPLALLGGLGLPVLMEITAVLRGRRALSEHSRVVLSWSAGVYLCAAGILLLIRWPGVHAGFHAWVAAAIESSQLSINARSAGFAFSEISQLPLVSTSALILIMIIGASPGGTAGGLKVTTLQILTRGTAETLAGRFAGRRFGVALVWTLGYLGLLCLATLALLMTEPDLHLDRSLFLAASAVGNVGLSNEPVVVSTQGLYVLSAAMMLGRIAPMMLLWYVMDTTADATVAIG